MDEHSTEHRFCTSVLALWLTVGLACIFVDHQIQPYLAGLGRIEPIGFAAVQWNQLGSALGLIAFFSVLLLAARPALKPAILCLAATGVLAQVLKYSIGRIRPNVSDDMTVFHGPLGLLNTGPSVAAIDSLPSGHTAAAFAMAFILSRHWPRAGWLWYFLAAGVAASRTLVDVHFPSDVVLGALLGTFVCQMILGRTKKLSQAKSTLALPP